MYLHFFDEDHPTEEVRCRTPETSQNEAMVCGLRANELAQRSHKAYACL